MTDHVDLIFTEVAAVVATGVTLFIMVSIVGMSLTNLQLVLVALGVHAVVWFLYAAFRYNFIDDVVDGFFDSW